MLSINIKASTATGIVHATFKVPGINLSLVILNPFNKAVSGAKAPIPKVSKKLTINPDTPALTKLPSPRFPSLLDFTKSFMKNTANIATKIPKTINTTFVNTFYSS